MRSEATPDAVAVTCTSRCSRSPTSKRTWSGEEADLRDGPALPSHHVERRTQQTRRVASALIHAPSREAGSNAPFGSGAERGHFVGSTTELRSEDRIELRNGSRVLAVKRRELVLLPNPGTSFRLPHSLGVASALLRRAGDPCQNYHACHPRSAQAVELRDGDRLVITSIELWSEYMVVRYARVRTNHELGHGEHITSCAWDVSDDLGNAYWITGAHGTATWRSSGMCASLRASLTARRSCTCTLR